MNLGGYNGGSGQHLLGVLLLIFIFIGPYLLLWLEVRAFRHSEAQTGMVFCMLILLGVPACYCAYRANELALIPFWFLGFQLMLMKISVVALPFTLAWEAYKHGWLTKLMTTKKNKKKKKQHRIEV